MIFVANVPKNSFDLVRLGLLRGVDIVVARVRVVKLVKVVHVVVVVGHLAGTRRGTNFVGSRSPLLLLGAGAVLGVVRVGRLAARRYGCGWIDG